MKDIEEDFNILKKRLDFINADHVKDLEFEMTSIAKKIEIYFKKPYQSGVGLVSQNENLRGKVRDIEEKLQKFHQILDGNFFFVFYLYASLHTLVMQVDQF